MSFEALRLSIEGRMAANWTATTVAYPNVNFTVPDVPWVRLTVINGPGNTQGITGSTPTVRDTGLVSLQIFVKEGVGTKPATELVDLFTPIYEHTRFGGILCYTATVNHLGVTNGWHQTNITIPFRRVRNV